MEGGVTASERNVCLAKQLRAFLSHYKCYGCVSSPLDIREAIALKLLLLQKINVNEYN